MWFPIYCLASVVWCWYVAPVIAQDSSAQYLQSAIHDLKVMQEGEDHEPPDMITHHAASSSHIHHKVATHEHGRQPTPALTKGEIAALFQAAVGQPPDDPPHPVYHHEDNTPAEVANKPIRYQASAKPDSSPASSALYEYYYYPMKIFLDEFATTNPHEYETPHAPKPPKKKTSPVQMHSHTHQHMVKITQEMEEKKKKSPLEPLFMAISGFIGMAMMFVFSMVILPKLGIKLKNSSSIPNADQKNRREQINEIARIAIQAIEKHRCKGRFGCNTQQQNKSNNNKWLQPKHNHRPVNKPNNRNKGKINNHTANKRF